MKTQASNQTVKYVDLLRQSQSDREAEDVQFKAEEASQQLQADILATNRSIASAKKKIVDLERGYPFNAKSIIEAQVELEGLQDGLIRLNELKKRLF